MIVINQGPASAIKFKSEPCAWIGRPGQELTVKAINGDGKLISTTFVSGNWEGATPPLVTGDVMIYEIAIP